jgi:Tol biopolymer transport system component
MPAEREVGYTELQTNLTGGRHANIRTMRAVLSRADGSGRRLIGSELADDKNSWTQFAGWSPDGKQAIIGRGWQSEANAAKEEAAKSFLFNAEGWLYDSFLVDVATGRSFNTTAVNRVSYYNAGLFFWPDDSKKLGFTALIDGQSHPFRMNLDGTGKEDLTSRSSEFTYGFSASPDGKRITYHKNYQVYLANADGSAAVKVETGNPFNFGPVWSPDGQWVLFLSGEHYKCHPFIVRADGSGLRAIANRGSYSGSVEFLDVFDFHHGSSDTPVWARDGKKVFFTAQSGENVELFEVGLDGVKKQMTSTSPGTIHYHPTPSPDGQFLAYGSKRAGVRQLFVMDLKTGEEKQITALKKGQGALWPHWRPVVK